MEVLGKDYMSSEDEIDDDDGGRLIVVRPLTWMSPKLRTTIRMIDNKYAESQNKRSRNQTARRREGDPSTRAAPANAPAFAVKPE